MPGIAERRAVHGGDALLLQQRQHEALVVGRSACRRALVLPMQPWIDGIHVERALRLVAVDARRLVQHLHHQVAALLEDLAHRLDRFLRPGQRLHRRGLAIELVFEVDWLCSLSIALISATGAPAKPMRQPVIA